MTVKSSSCSPRAAAAASDSLLMASEFGSFGAMSAAKRVARLMQEFDPLGPHLRAHGVDASQVVARPVEAVDETQLDQVPTGAEDDRNGRGRCFCGEHAGRGARRNDDRHAPADQIGRQFR